MQSTNAAPADNSVFSYYSGLSGVLGACDVSWITIGGQSYGTLSFPNNLPLILQTSSPYYVYCLLVTQGAFTPSTSYNIGYQFMFQLAHPASPGF